MLIEAGGKCPRPYRLWSLWDMLRVYALKYIELGEAVAKVRQNFYDAGDLGHPLSAIQRQELRETLEELAAVCGQMELKTQAELVRRSANDLPQSARELEMLIAAVYGELKSRVWFYLSSESAGYYEWAEIVTDKVATEFPGASAELREAANCYALARYTAAVFHSMRAAEIGTRALAFGMKLRLRHPIELSEWQAILTAAQRRIEAIGKQRRTRRRDADLSFFGQAAAQLQFFKDGWRVRVMHARAGYSQQQAKDAIDHVRAFFETLAERLREE